MKLLFLLIFLIPSFAFAQAPIQGVKQHRTAIIGIIKPKITVGTSLITSFNEFSRQYEATDIIKIQGQDIINYTALSVKAFFENGGKELKIIPVQSRTLADYMSALNSIKNKKDIKIVLTPGATQLNFQEQISLLNYKASFADKLFVNSGSKNLTANDLITLAGSAAADNLVLLAPWIKSHLSVSGAVKEIPGDGFYAGTLSKVEQQRGVHKAPANINLVGIEDVVQNFTNTELAQLNQAHVIPLRSIRTQNRFVFFGARTLSQKPEMLYVNVFRLKRYVLDSVEQMSSWTKHQVNDSHLWQKVEAYIYQFAQSMWSTGMLQGNTIKQAFFVRCDQSTMSEQDLLQGKVVCSLGLSIMRPEEFFLFKIELPTQKDLSPCLDPVACANFSIRATTYHNLYFKAENKITYRSSGPVKIEVTGASHTHPRNGLITIYPNSSKVGLKVLQNGEVIYQKSFQVKMAPKPSLKLTIGGQNFNGLRYLEPFSTLNAQVVADSEYSSDFPDDSLYFFDELRIYVKKRNGSSFRQVKSFRGDNRVVMRSGLEIKLSDIAGLESGDLVAFYFTNFYRRSSKWEKIRISVEPNELSRIFWIR